MFPNMSNDFLEKYKDVKIVFLELGVGKNTPGIIKYPFMSMTFQNENATYISINKEDFYLSKALETRSIILKTDIAKVLSDIAKIV